MGREEKASHGATRTFKLTATPSDDRKVEIKKNFFQNVAFDRDFWPK